MNRRKVFSIGLGVLILTWSGCGKEDRPDSADTAKLPPTLAGRGSPNVLLITLDAVRFDHLRCYGYERQTSPRIDQLAGEGALFESCVSASSWSLPSHASILTGMAAAIHGVVDVQKKLSDRYVTMAEDFKNAGYRTAGFVSNPFLSDAFGLNDGFEEYVECMNPLPDDAAARDAGAASPAVVKAVEDWLGRSPARPFLLFVNFSDAMLDYTPPPPFDKQFDPDYVGWVTGRNVLTNPRINPDMDRRDLEHLIALYDGEIAWVDQNVGRLLDLLMTKGLLDSTVIVLTSSHGTEFFEHQMIGQRSSLFDDLIRVPLLIRYPRHVQPGKRYKEQCRGIDLYPTIADLVGLPIPMVMGRPLTPLFRDRTIDTRGGPEAALSELTLYGRTIQAIRQPGRKTVWYVDLNRGQVYDLVADPGELAAVADRESPTAQAARKDAHWALKSFIPEFEGKFPAADTLSGLPAIIRAKLDALGYVDGQLPIPEQTKP